MGLQFGRYFFTHSYNLHIMILKILIETNAAVNGHLELPLLKDRQRFDAVSTSNLVLLKFRDW